MLCFYDINITLLDYYRKNYAILNPTYESIHFQDTITCDDVEYWIEVMKDEMQSVYENNTFTLCDLSLSKKCIDSRWVYKIKRDENNEFEHFKAWVVAEEYSQVFSIDFDKIYASVVHIDIIRHLFALAVFFNLHIIHIDVKTIFINGNTDFEFYIE